MEKNYEILGANVTQLAIVYQHFSAQVNRAVEPLSLNMTQMSILTRLINHPHVNETVTSLSQAMDMNQPMVTKAVKAMVNNGLIARQISDEDARVSFLKLSEKGKQTLVKAQEHCMPLIDKTFAGLEHGEALQLLTLLSRLKGNLIGP